MIFGSVMEAYLRIRLVALSVLFGTMLTMNISQEVSAQYEGHVMVRALIDHSGEPANQFAPPCKDGPGASASQIVARIGDVIDEQIGSGGIVAAIFNRNRTVRNWLLVRLGLHAGLSTCRVLCVYGPPNLNQNNTHWKACMVNHQHGNKCRGPTEMGNLPHHQHMGGWALVENPTVAYTRRHTVMCANFRNWKHNWPRWTELHVYWK